MAYVSIEELKQGWVGFEFDVTNFEIREQNALEWAKACGKTDPRFIDRFLVG